MKTGLTLGKFAPLHKGHQCLIETALAETDHLIVVIYDAPQVTNIPLPVRADWVRTLYPQVEVIEAWGGPQEVGNTPEIMRVQEEFLLNLLDGRRITHFYSSEFYGEHVSKALGAEDCRFDEARVEVPVSGSAIRGNEYEYRSFLAPEVYRDLVTRVVFLGAPSTGKTSLARTLAERFNTCWMPEYGREYWETHQIDHRLTPEQLVEIAEGHIAREDSLILEANRYLFVDTDATTTYQFAMDYHGSVLPRLAELAEQARNRYGRFFLCGDDIPYDDTWDRSGEVKRAEFQRLIRADLISRRIPYTELHGDLESRVEIVESVLR